MALDRTLDGYPSRVAVEILLEDHGSVVVNVRGNSMVPALRPGARVRVTRCGPGDLRVGDVALWRANDTLCLHRVVGRHPDGRRWITRGDYLREPDPPFEPGALLGRVEGLQVLGRPWGAGHPAVVGGARVLWLGLLPVVRPGARLVRALLRRVRPAGRRT